MKFFLFNISELSLGSQRASDSGVGISVVCIPVHKLSNITASRGFINMTFDDAGIYEEAFMNVGDAREKVNISIAAQLGEEQSLIESIIAFIIQKQGNPVIKFDAIVTDKNVSGSNIKSSSDILAKISTMPISMETGRLSVGTAEEEYQDSIAGINFRGNLPILDFNHEGLTSYADGDEITSWANAGTGGSTYSIAANQGTPSCETSAATSNISQKSAFISVGEYFIVPNSFKVKDDYTIYCVLGQAIPRMAMYGDDAGETVGFGGSFPSGVDLNNATVKDKKNSFSVRHSGITGAVATTQTDNSDFGTTDYKWPKSQIANYVVADCDVDVFIIRRDEHFNMILHNRDGDIIGFIPGVSKKENEHLHANSPGRTDGDLLIEVLGTVKDIAVTAGLGFRGYIGRFGVIPNDIGASRSAILAQDLFNFYKV